MEALDWNSRVQRIRFVHSQRRAGQPQLAVLRPVLQQPDSADPPANTAGKVARTPNHRLSGLLPIGIVWNVRTSTRSGCTPPSVVDTVYAHKRRNCRRKASPSVTVSLLFPVPRLTKQ